MNECDHDVLIRLETSLKLICTKVDKVSDKVEALSQSGSKRITWGQFIPIMIALSGLVGGIIAFNYNIDSEQHKQITSNSNVIIKNVTKLESLSERLKEAGK